MSDDLEPLCTCPDPGPRPTPCAKCGGHVLFSVREGHALPGSARTLLEAATARARAQCANVGGPPVELEPDPFERIDTLAAELRNAYRAYERRDRTATLAHGTRAAHHFVKLLAGLTG